MGLSSSSAHLGRALLLIVLLAAIGIDGFLWPQQAKLEDNSIYDYIVVGTGTAGCVVARRLAEDKEHTVFAIEAGGDPPLISLVASAFAFLPNTPVDYKYTSTRDSYAAGSQNNYSKLPTGKMLGGSASMCHFLYLRGTARDYDSWAELSNDETWKYENVIQSFKKSERLLDDEILKQYGEFHGTDGPTGITRELKDVGEYLEAFAETGTPTVLDLNANITLGYTQPQYILADRKRQTPALTYLKPIKDYPNLFVSKNTRVTKIIFENNVAVAVQAVYAGKTYTFRAKKEIILSAGVYNTPQLLMLSGIGPQKHLETLNIPVLHDLPVGDDMVDQVAVTLVYKLKQYLLPIPEFRDIFIDPTRIPFPVMVGSIALNKSDTDPNYQVYSLLFKHDTPFLPIACLAAFELRSQICNRWKKQVKSRDSLYNFILNLQPQSRGFVRLRSESPSDDPIITTGYFKNEEDLKDMVNYVKDFIRVGNTTYFRKMGAGIAGLDLPECADKEIGSDEYWKCYVLNHASTAFHPVGTCAMGKVVDGKLKVKGVDKLRIVDGSVIPKVPRAGTVAAIIMLAEKASELIKKGL